MQEIDELQRALGFSGIPSLPLVDIGLLKVTCMKYKYCSILIVIVNEEVVLKEQVKGSGQECHGISEVDFVRLLCHVNDGIRFRRVRGVVGLVLVGFSELHGRVESRGAG